MSSREFEDELEPFIEGQMKDPAFAAAFRAANVGDALERLVGEAWDDGNAMGLDGWEGPNRGAGEVDPEAELARERVVDRVGALLAAHPVAPPARCTKTTYGGIHGVVLCNEVLVNGACPQNQKHFIDDESASVQVAKLLGEFACWQQPQDHLLEYTARVMQLARPMPTRERIAAALHKAMDHPNTDRCPVIPTGFMQCGYIDQSNGLADAVLALLTGAES